MNQGLTRPVRWPGIVLPSAVALAAVWSLVPVGVWFAGADLRYYSAAWNAWLWGAVIALLLTALALLLTRGRAALALVAGWRRLALRPGAGVFVAAVAALLAALALLACLFVFSGNPRNVDGFAELFQARIFLAGRLWAPPPPDVASFATLHMIVGPTRWFSQYPPGQPLVLAAGLALGAWWLLNPLFVAGLVVATYRVARWGADETTARLSVALLCLSPFVVAVSGSEMSHLPAAALGMLAAAAATSVGGRRGFGAALAAGAALGAMAAFRPLDAVAAAVPVALIVLVAAPPRRRLAVLAAVALAGGAVTLPTLWYNAGTTGSWHQFGYTYLWGPEHSLGFHPVPWGVPLTPLRAVGLTGLDLHQLNLYLFDAPFPILVLVAAGLIAGRRRLGARDAVLVAGALALSGLLFFYWHRDVFYGPRFLFTAVPWFVLLVARSLVVLRRSGRELYPGVTRGLAALLAFCLVVVLGLVSIAPARVKAYRRATPVFDLHPDRDARRAGLSHAVVTIPDGWGSRLIARMWALGVSAQQSTRLYAAIDACRLEQALDAASLDTTGAARRRLVSTLDSLAALREPGVPTGATEDPNLRLRPGAPLPAVCRAELARDSTGFLEFAPFLYLNRALLNGDIVWARDLGPWNNALFARYPGRRLYRYAPRSPGGRPVFVPLERGPAADGDR
jgi:hypothetical protein